MTKGYVVDDRLAKADKLPLNRLRPWPFFLDVLGVGAEAGSGAGGEPCSACARISWAKSKS